MGMNMPVQPTIVEYKVCMSLNPTSLAEDVNRELSKGFTVHGPLVMNGTSYVQPLVRVELRQVKMPEQNSNIVPIQGRVIH